MEAETGRSEAAGRRRRTSNPAGRSSDELFRWALREKHAYAHGEERPLGSFLVMLGAYSVTLGALGAIVRRSGTSLQARPQWGDLALATVATHKLSRLIAKDPVTSPLRAPFTRFAGQSGEAELAEEVRGAGPRKAMGELVTCPFCVGQWVATGFTFGFVLAPGPTRIVASIFTALTGADVLQLAYAKGQQAATDSSS